MLATVSLVIVRVRGAEIKMFSSDFLSIVHVFSIFVLKAERDGKVFYLCALKLTNKMVVYRDVVTRKECSHNRSFL